MKRTVDHNEKAAPMAAQAPALGQHPKITDEGIYAIPPKIIDEGIFARPDDGYGGFEPPTST